MKKPIEIDLDALEGSSEAGHGDDAVIVEDAGKGEIADDVIDMDIDPRDKLPDHAIQNADGSVTLPLMEAVNIRTRKDGKVKETPYAELTFTRLNGADMRAISATSDEMQNVVTFARSTRIPVAVMTAIFDQMDMADIADGGRILNHFLARGRKTPK